MHSTEEDHNELLKHFPSSTHPRPNITDRGPKDKMRQIVEIFRWSTKNLEFCGNWLVLQTATPPFMQRWFTGNLSINKLPLVPSVYSRLGAGRKKVPRAEIYMFGSFVNFSRFDRWYIAQGRAHHFSNITKFLLVLKNSFVCRTDREISNFSRSCQKTKFCRDLQFAPGLEKRKRWLCRPLILLVVFVWGF